ncbi:MAG: 2-phosphosulfolactate phosphatase [Gemmatimonadaceae bacterium]
MRIDVVFGSLQSAAPFISGRTVVVVDVLRASTTIAVALANGAKSVVPMESADEVIARAKTFERSEVRLAGERKMLAIAGFDMGNSPAEFTPEAVEGKTVLLTTTNGTAAVLGLQGAREVVVASYVNFSAVAAMLRSALRGGTDATIVCAGRDRQFSLEDAACAGRFVRSAGRRLSGISLNDAAEAALLIDRKYGDGIEGLLADSEHGRALEEAGFADDLVFCSVLDSHPVIPVYQDRHITRFGPDRER